MDKQNKKLKDHRQIGQEQELFFIDDEVGPGLPMWLPKGAIIRRELDRYITDLEISQGYLHVVTPHLAKLELYKKSGHWQHYKNSMYPSMKRDNEEYELRPMNCPHHIQIFKLRPRSYRELPMRIAEMGTFYRWENSGELSGLQRVRGMTLNDAHIFCSLDQVKDEFVNVVKLIEKVYKDLGLKKFWYRLSLHDPKDKKKYIDNPKGWEMSEKSIKDALKELKLKYKVSIGDAAFYGPKLDVQIPNALGKDETVSTVQIDFSLPEKFNLKYIDKDGKGKDIVIIHRGIISTLERMVGFLAEQYQGAFPLWLSPVQVMIIPITDKHVQNSKKILDELKENGIRAELDDRAETMQSKVRDAALQKVPYLVIIGDKEIEDSILSVRQRSGKVEKFTLSVFLQNLKKEIDKKI